MKHLSIINLFGFIFFAIPFYNTINARPCPMLLACRESFLTLLQKSNGRALLSKATEKMGDRWIHSFPFLNLLQPIALLSHTDNHQSHYSCSKVNKFLCIEPLVFQYHGAPYAWGCYTNGACFITVMYNVKLYSGSPLEKNVIQIFTESPTGGWTTKQDGIPAGYIKHIDVDFADEEEEITWQDFQSLAMLLIEGTVTVKSSKYGFVTLSLDRNFGHSIFERFNATRSSHPQP